MVITIRCRRIVCTVNYCVSKAFHLFSPETQFVRDTPGFQSDNWHRGA